MKDLKKEIETILDGSNMYLQDYEINGETKRGLTKAEVIEWIIETLLQEERKRTLEEVREVIDMAQKENYEYFEVLEEVEYFIKTGKNNIKLLRYKYNGKV